jgi:hypothetical protein
MAASMKMTAFWDVAPCSILELDRRFRCAYCLYHQGDRRESTSDTSANFYETTRRNIPEDSHLQVEIYRFSQEQLVVQNTGA